MKETIFRLRRCFGLLFLISGIVSVSAQAPMRVDAIYTNYNSETYNNTGFWQTNAQMANGQDYETPLGYHDLLAFRFGNVVYSTGISDQTLTGNGIAFQPALFRSFPAAVLNNIKLENQSTTYFLFGALSDDSEEDAICPFSPPAALPVVMDGLNLGSAVKNLPAGTFTLKIRQVNEEIIGTDIPIILVSEMMNATGNLAQAYFVDAQGSLVGNRLEVGFATSQGTPLLGAWAFDAFKPNDGSSIDLSLTEGEMRFWAKTANDFGLTQDNYAQVKGLVYKSIGGPSPAFIAYNTNLRAVKAVPDNVTTYKNKEVNIPVLENDSYIDFETVTVEILSGPSHGTLNINSDKTITYTPEPEYSGPDSFRYIIRDSGFSSSTTVTITVKEINFWTGNVSTKWEDVGNWSGGYIPGDQDDVIYSDAAQRNLTLGTNLALRPVNKKIRNLLIPQGKSLIINPNASLTVTGTVDVGDDPNRIQIRSHQNVKIVNASLIIPTAENVYATVEMNSRGTAGGQVKANKIKWQYFGIPMATLSAMPTFDKTFLRSFKETNTQPGKHWYMLKNQDILQKFIGYEIAPVQDARKYVFKGKLINEDFEVTLGYTPNGVYPGHHLLANSYAAAIDISKISFGANMENTIYVYFPGTKEQWIAQPSLGNSNTNIVPGQYLAIPKNQAAAMGIPALSSMQGFFVKALGGGPGATVAVNYREAVVRNSTPQRAPGNTGKKEKVFTVVTAESKHHVDRVWLFTDPDCSNSFDNGSDGFKMAVPTNANSLSVLQNDAQYQVHATNDLHETKLGFKAGGTDTQYKLHFHHMNLGDAYEYFYLLDYETGDVVDVKADGSVYEFVANNSKSVKERFALLTRPSQTPSPQPSEDDNILVSVKNRVLLVHNKSQSSGIISFCDLSGRVLYQQTLLGTEKLVIPLPEYQKGAYFLRVLYDNQTVKTKKIVLSE